MDEIVRRIGDELDRIGIGRSATDAIVGAIDAAGFDLVDRATGERSRTSVEVECVRFRARGVVGVTGLGIRFGDGWIVMLERGTCAKTRERSGPVFVSDLGRFPRSAGPEQ